MGCLLHLPQTYLRSHYMEILLSLLFWSMTAAISSVRQNYCWCYIYICVIRPDRSYTHQQYNEHILVGINPPKPAAVKTYLVHVAVTSVESPIPRFQCQLINSAPLWIWWSERCNLWSPYVVCREWCCRSAHSLWVQQRTVLPWWWDWAISTWVIWAAVWRNARDCWGRRWPRSLSTHWRPCPGTSQSDEGCCAQDDLHRMDAIIKAKYWMHLPTGFNGVVVVRMSCCLSFAWNGKVYSLNILQSMLQFLTCFLLHPDILDHMWVTCETCWTPRSPLLEQARIW